MNSIRGCMDREIECIWEMADCGKRDSMMKVGER
jgi:hypothetical protein